MLKKIILFITILSGSLYAFTFNSKPTKITDNVWCFLGEITEPTEENGGFMSNNCYIKTKESYVLVDTGSSYNFAKHTYNEMSKIEKLPVSHIIISHVHDDHWLGNSYFKEKFNSIILGPSLINSQHHIGEKTRMMNILPEDIMENTKVVKIDEVVSKNKTIIVSDKKIEIIPIQHKAHTEEDLIVYLPNEKVLFAGDLVMNGRITSNRDGNLIGLIKALEKIESLKWDYLIPGHGHDTSKTAANEIRLYTSLLKERILLAVEDEVDADSITKIVRLEEFKDHSMYDIFNKRNVFDAFRELEFYEEE